MSSKKQVAYLTTMQNLSLHLHDCMIVGWNDKMIWWNGQLNTRWCESKTMQNYTHDNEMEIILHAAKKHLKEPWFKSNWQTTLNTEL